MQCQYTSKRSASDLLERGTLWIITVRAATRRRNGNALTSDNSSTKSVGEIGGIGAVQVARVAASNRVAVRWAQVRNVQAVWTLRDVNTLFSF